MSCCRRMLYQSTDLVAIPLHLASTFNATLSPKSSSLALPLTVATCFTGSNLSPSFICHSTLHREKIGGCLGDPLNIRQEQSSTHRQPSCANISSTNGTPASTAVCFPLPNKNASRGASPTMYPPQSNDGASSATHAFTVLFQLGGSR